MAASVRRSVSMLQIALFMLAALFMMLFMRSPIYAGNALGPGATDRMSIHTNGAEGDLDSQFPASNTDGTLIAFQSDATTLVANDTNGKRDIFLHNRTTGVTTRVSVGPGGVQANGDCSTPVMSTDGKFIAYVSDASNLVAGDTNNCSDIFLYNVAAATTTRVSVGPAGAQADGASYSPSISADGKKIVFVSDATNLVAGDTNGMADVFFYNRTTAVTTRVSTSATGGQADGASKDPVISGDGTTVAFTTLADNLAAADTNSNNDIYVKTLASGALQCLTLAADGTASDDGSFLPKLSADGRYVAFTTRATNLLLKGPGNAGDTNGKQDIYLADRQGVAGLTLTQVSKTTLAQGDGDSGQGGLNLTVANGVIYVVFESVARNLLGAGNDTNNKSDIYLWQSDTAAISRMSVSSLGDQANEISLHPVISTDASTIAYDSLASNLVANDTNGAYDVFIHLRGAAYQPDLLLSATGAANTYIGGSVYLPGDSQTLETSVNTAVAGNFFVELYNAPQNPTGNFILKVSGYDATAGWTVTFQDMNNGMVDVPIATLTGAGFAINNLAPNTTYVLKATVKTFASLPATPPLALTFTATSVDDTSRKDTVLSRVSLLPDQTIMASVDSTGAGITGNDCGFSADGRYVSFECGPHIKQHDRMTGITKIVSVAADGTTLPNQGCADQDTSGDGRFVIFKTKATNLTADVTGGVQEIFMKDMQTGAVTLVSRADGVNGAVADADCAEAVISPNGQFVAFASKATTLIAGGGNGAQQVYLRDLVKNTTTVMSTNNAGALANGDCFSCGITSTGNFVTWRTTANNLVDLNGDAAYDNKDDGNGKQDVFLHDVAKNTTELISVNKDGTGAGDDTSSKDYRSPVSDDGRFVAFSSLAKNLIANQLDPGGKRQIFVRDRQLAVTVQLSIGFDGKVAADNCDRPTITLDGHYVGFTAGTSVLLAMDTNTKSDIYIADTTKVAPAGLEVASLPYNYVGNTNTPQSTIDSQDPFISGDGRFISFEATGADATPSNLVRTNPGYTSTNNQQIYVRDRWSLQPDLGIRKTGDQVFLGPGVINTTGLMQTLGTVRAAAGATTSFDVQLKNTGSTTDTITLTGTAGGQGWTVVYKDSLGTDITAQMTAAGYAVANMKTGDTAAFTILVTSDPLLLAGTPQNLIVTATSGKNTATKDRVKASVTIQGAAKGDLQIRSISDEAFIGNNIYGDPTEQTKTLSVLNGKTATYIIRIENDGGNGDDSYTLTAGTLGVDWDLVFKAADGSDITEQITSINGWSTNVPMTMGDYVEVRMLVTPHANLNGGANSTVLINSVSNSDATAADAVQAQTLVTVLHQPDLIIQGPSMAMPLGDNTYDDGTTQTAQEVVQRGKKISYAVTLQNDGNVTEKLPVTGTAGDADWTIDYYDTTGGGNVKVTAAVVGGTWPAAAMAMGEAKTLRIDVTPRLGMNAGDAKTITLTAAAAGDAKKTDANIAVTTTAIRKPDLLVKLQGAKNFIGDGQYPPALQEATTSVDNGTIAAYALQLQNDGNTQDTYKLTMPADGNGWTFHLYQGTDTSTEITAQVRAGTWTATLGAGGAQDLLLQATPDATLYGGTVKSVTLTATSTNEPVSTDVATMTTTVTVRHLGDGLIQGDGDLIYVGGNLYTGTAQIKEQPVRAGKVATYRVKVENDGNVDDTFTLFCAKPGVGWTLTATAEATNTSVLTELTGVGLSLPLTKGASATYLLKISGDATLPSGTSLQTLITVKLGAVTEDVVTATTLLVGSTERMSVDSLGVQGNGDSPSLNSPAVISQDGRYVVFSSGANNLVTGDTNSVTDVFLRDRVTGTITRVSVSSTGAQANGSSDMPAISPDGRYIAFRSVATNLVAGDTNSKADVFLYDRQTGITTRESLTNSGAQALSGDSGTYGIALSNNAQYLVFESAATNLVTGDTNNVSDIFLRDRVLNKTIRVSSTPAGGPVNGRSQNPSISADGRYIAYGSFASNLVANDGNGFSDIFLYDRVAGTNTLVSQSGGVLGNANSDDPALSGDGNWIAYMTQATNLAAGSDTNGTWDVVRVSSAGGAATLMSGAPDGTAGNGASSGPAMNFDGRFTAFRSYATNLVANDTNGKCDAFVHDVVTGVTLRASLTGNGGQVNGDSAVYGVALDGVGYIAVFDSLATNLVPDDTNSRRDVFAREWPSFQPDLVIHVPGETATLGDGIYYNSDAQTKVVNVQAGQTATYELIIQNDGQLTDSYTLSMSSVMKANWTITVAGPDGVLVPALATQNGAWVVSLAGGQAKTLTVTMTPSAAVLPTYYQEMLFTVVSGTMSDRLDVVKLKTVRARPTATLTAGPASVLPGMPVTLTATNSSTASVTYSFAAKVKDVNGLYVAVATRDYDPSPTWVWTPAAPGTYALCLYTKEVGQTLTTSSYVYNYIVVSPISAVTLKPYLPSPQSAYTFSNTLIATVTGGLVPEYQFQVAKRDPKTLLWGPYTELRAFATGKSATWRPATAGEYTLRVNAREQGNPTVLATGDIASFIVVPALSAVTLTPNPLTGTVGLPVTLTAKPTGGLAPEYRFLCDVTDWFGVVHTQEIQAYSASNTATWYPTTDHVGTVTLSVLVREQKTTSSYAVKKAISYTVAKP